MTLTLPTPDAGDTARQRFALELLLQQPVPGPEQLLASRNLLNDALPDVSPDQWRALQAMPIAIGADHLDIVNTLPSRFGEKVCLRLLDSGATQLGLDKLIERSRRPIPATALRAFMRQDPDVLLVGETRDLETAKTAIEAALTGQPVARPGMAGPDRSAAGPLTGSAALIDQWRNTCTIRLHPAIEADLQRALATETDQPTPDRAHPIRSKHSRSECRFCDPIEVTSHLVRPNWPCHRWRTELARRMSVQQRCSHCRQGPRRRAADPGGHGHRRQGRQHDVIRQLALNQEW